MSALSYMVTVRRKLSLAVVSSALVFAFLTLVPFEYQRTMGYDATFSGIDVERCVDPVHLTGVLKTLGYENVVVNLVVDAGKASLAIKKLPTRYAIREVTGVLAGITGYEGEPIVLPVLTTVSGSLYAQVKSELALDDFDLEIEGKSDEEIKAMVLEQLKERGWANAVVNVERLATSTSEDPKIKITIRVGESGADVPKCKIADFDIGDIDIHDMSKTDVEITALIEQRLLAKGITDAKVSVTTNADGKRSAKIALQSDCD